MISATTANQSPGMLPLARLANAIVFFMGLTVLSAPARAADAPVLAVELNKLETYEKGCRAYVVVTNSSEQAYQAFKLDLVLFQPDGIIARRFGVDLGPLKGSKKTVKLFDVEGLACDKIASVLVNDIMECKSDQGTAVDCLPKMSLSSVAGVPLNR